MKTLPTAFLIGLSAVAMSTALAEDTEATKKDLAQLQGEWSMVSGSADGNAICFGSPGAERPADFTSKPGDGRTLSVWKRKKTTDPVQK